MEEDPVLTELKAEKNRLGSMNRPERQRRTEFGII